MPRLDTQRSIEDVRPTGAAFPQTTTELKKVVHEVRWLPPDPNDTSVEIQPEPD